MSIYAATWEILTVTVEGNITFYDKDSIQYLPGNIVRYWEKSIPSKDQRNRLLKAGGVRYRDLSTIRSLKEINCSKKQNRLLSVVFYDSAEGVLDSADETRQWRNIVPESLGENAFEELCPQKKRK
jgi:hypothetical protein